MSNAIRSLDRDLWVMDHPFKMPGGIELGARTTVVRLADGTAWVHSPGPATAEDTKWLAEHGPVSALVSPNLLHHFFLKDAAGAFPDARVYGPAGLEEKLKGGLTIEPLVAGATPWEAELASLGVGGCPKMNEIVFLHASTRTLIVTDLAFNFETAGSWLTRVFLRINGSLGRFGPSRLAKSVFMQDHAAVGASVEQILEWDFDRVVLSHGEVLESGGPDALRRAYDWLLA